MRTKNFVPELENEEFGQKKTHSLKVFLNFGTGNEIWVRYAFFFVCCFDLQLVLRDVDGHAQHLCDI